MKVGIIGCGFIGLKRAQNLSSSAEIVACADIQHAAATKLASLHAPQAQVTTEWQHVVNNKEVDLVVVATRHASLAEITLAAVRLGKHVLVEKPAARCAEELLPILKLQQQTGSLVRVGFNHRYHPAFLQAKTLIAQPRFGDLMYIRARYGHGGRIGYDKEWRAQKELSGGGELIDQGMHLIDLSRMFLGDFSQVQAQLTTSFWPMQVEDNAFMMLQTFKKQTAFLHASWTEWKNLFSFEIFSSHAKLEISGLGGSYGVETLKYYQMRPEMGPPETTIWEYPGADCSWLAEFNEFVEDIRLSRKPAADISDAFAALKIVDQIYQEHKL